LNRSDYEQNVRDFIERLRHEKKLQESSLRLYQIDLTQLEPIVLENKPHVIRELLSKFAPSTASRKMIVWRSFLRSLPLPYKQWLDAASLPKIRTQQPRFLREQEIFALENACFKRTHSARDRLFVLFGVELGLRLNEILSLRFGDLSEDWIRVLRKGGHEQNLPLSKSLQALIRIYREERRATVEDFIFEGRAGNSLTPRAGQKILTQLAKEAGLQKKLSPHALRHTFATRLAANGASLVALKEILGHRQLKTTERYLHVTPEYLRDALQFLRPRLN
jgi:integrase/recombinase XerD